jgi:SAM-dependent methyltransferase
VSEHYTETAIHFDVERLPRLLASSLAEGPLALADLGCGDEPLFAALAREGVIAPSRPVYAVDLEAGRLARVSEPFPWISTIVASADSVPEIPDESLDAVISTMVMEHVPDERAYLAEIRRILRPGGRAYVTTVFKRTWAWYSASETASRCSTRRTCASTRISAHSADSSRAPASASSRSSGLACGSHCSILSSSGSADAFEAGGGCYARSAPSRCRFPATRAWRSSSSAESRLVASTSCP